MSLKIIVSPSPARYLGFMLRSVMVAAVLNQLASYGCSGDQQLAVVLTYVLVGSSSAM